MLGELLVFDELILDCEPEPEPAPDIDKAANTQTQDININIQFSRRMFLLCLFSK